MRSRGRTVLGLRLALMGWLLSSSLGLLTDVHVAVAHPAHAEVAHDTHVHGEHGHHDHAPLPDPDREQPAPDGSTHGHPSIGVSHLLTSASPRVVPVSVCVPVPIWTWNMRESALFRSHTPEAPHAPPLHLQAGSLILRI